jgi:DNA recombination protein RmuC
VNEVGAVKVNTRNLIDYASNERKVIIVSPTTFSAYLKTVLFGLQALKIEEQAKEIKDNVEKLGKHLNAYESFHQKVGGSLSTTVNHYNRSFKELKKVDKDVMKITEGDSVLKLEDGEVDRPKVED